MDRNIIPFEQHLAQVLSYPLKGDNLIAIGVLALLGFLLSGFFFLGILIWIATYNFAYGVLSHTAAGHLSPRAGYFDQMGSAVAWKQFVLWMILGVLVALLYQNFGWALAAPALLLALGILPVATMALAMDQSLAAALNPLTWLGVIQRMGGSYGKLLGICGLLIAGCWGVGWLLSFVPVLGQLGAEFVNRYGIVATFYLLGYVIYQYHDEFGMGLTAPEIITSAEPGNDPTVLQAQQLLDEGNTEAARQSLHQAAAEQGPFSPAAGALLELCAATNDVAGQLTVISARMVVHLADDEFDQALPLLDEAQALNPNFLMPEPDASLALCKHVLSRGESRKAITLAQGFVRNFPGHKDVVGHAFLTARIFTEKLGRDADALKILEQMVVRYAGHPQIQTITNERDRVAALVPDSNAGQP